MICRRRVFRVAIFSIAQEILQVPTKSTDRGDAMHRSAYREPSPRGYGHLSNRPLWLLKANNSAALREN
jgi:hypothetical protein